MESIRCLAKGGQDANRNILRRAAALRPSAAHSLAGGRWIAVHDDDTLIHVLDSCMEGQAA